MMEKDRRYTTVKHLISGGHVKTFREIFDIIPKSVVARDLGMNNMRFTRLINHVEQFLLKDLFRFAIFLEVDNMILLEMINRQYWADKENKKKR